VRAGVQRISSDHHTGQVQVGQQWPEPGHLARRAVDVSLGQHGAGGVVHGGEQVDLPALGATGAAQRLAVDRDLPSTPVETVAVSQPGAPSGVRSPSPAAVSPPTSAFISSATSQATDSRSTSACSLASSLSTRWPVFSDEL
jgi:hypothetical protein